jgi:hypothetical protein
LTVWKSSSFNGHVVFHNSFALSVELNSVLDGNSWILTDIYAPCSNEGRLKFLDWINNVEMPEDTDWLLLGDFDMIRRPLIGIGLDEMCKIFLL